MVGALNNDFKQRRKDSPQAVVDKVGDILVKRVRHDVLRIFLFFASVRTGWFP
jgi:hypothetical protein